MIIGVVPALCLGCHLKAPENRANYPMYLFEKKLNPNHGEEFIFQ
jgi:hypothetical protein